MSLDSAGTPASSSSASVDGMSRFHASQLASTHGRLTTGGGVLQDPLVVERSRPSPSWRRSDWHSATKPCQSPIPHSLRSRSASSAHKTEAPARWRVGQRWEEEVRLNCG